MSKARIVAKMRCNRARKHRRLATAKRCYNARLMEKIFIVIAATLWGIDGVLRQNVYTLPAEVVVLTEHVIGLIILTIVVLWKRMSIHLPKAAIRPLIFVALFSGLFGTLAFTKALQFVHFIPLSVVFLVQKLQPIFTITTAWIILKERPRSEFWLWTFAALTASFFLTFPSGTINASLPLSPHLMAALFALIAAASWGTSTVFSKLALRESSLFSITYYRFAFTTLFAIPTVFLLGSTGAVATISGAQYLTLLAIALSTGMVSVVIYYKGLARVPAHVACILELAFPVTGFLVDQFVYKTPLHPIQYVSAIILVGVMYQIARLKPHAIHQS